MRLESVKKILVTALCVALISSDFIPAFAEVVGEEETTEATTEVAATVEEADTEVATETSTEETSSSADLTGEEATTEETEPEETASTEAATEETTTEETTTEEATTEEVTTEEVTEEETQKEEAVLEQTAGGVKVQLKAAAGVLPEGAALSVRELPENNTDSENVRKTLNEMAAERKAAVQSYRAFDLTLLVNGKEVQPAEDVQVSFATDFALAEKESIAVYHFADDTKAVEVPCSVNGGVVEITAGRFSVYAVAVLKEESAEADKEVVLEQEVNGVKVQLKAAAGVLPANAALSVKEIPQTGAESKDIQKALDEKTIEKAEAVQKYRAFDITILADGKEVQPKGDVVVSFTGDMLLPQDQEEKVAVYHIDEDAIASEVKSEVLADAVEMTTSHFSVYAVATTKSVAETMFNITVDHYLAEDQDKPAEKRAPFYEKDEINDIASGSIVQVPVQGGDDYEITLVKIANGETEISITGEELVAAGTKGFDINGLRFTGDKEKKVLKFDLDEINTAAKDVKLELFYKPLEKEHHNPVTAFDYSIMSEGPVEIHDTLPIWYDVVISCDYKGTRYENVQFRTGGLYKGDTKLVSVEADTVFTNLSIKGQSQVYGKVYYEKREKGLGFYFDGTANALSAKNAGINSYGRGKSNYLAMGQTGSVHNYECKGNSKGLNANINNADANSGSNPEKAIIPGLVTGLTPDYKDVIATVEEPGYFNDKPLVGKEIYDDRFDLKFHKNGHKYSLTSAIDTVSGRETLSDKGNNEFFFPLNDVERNDTIAAINAIQDSTLKFDTDCLKQGTEENNCFFGLRYDFTFKLGDYIGPLQYTFVGDDDLWVFMDGELVLDLGGLHQPYPVKYAKVSEPNVVDLWQFIDPGHDEPGHKGSYDRTKEHQITVLFMERGAWNSSCYMEFILPDAAPIDSVITDKPKGNVEFTKTDDSGAKLEGAVFEAYRRINAGGETTDTMIQRAVSDGNGVVRFTGLKEGNYIIKEVSAPEGYIADEKEYAVTVVGNQTVTINGGTVVNEKEKTVPFEFIKVDAETKEPVAGAKFELFRKDEAVAGQQGDRYTQSVGTAESGKDGKVVFNDLREGDYLLKEVAPAVGYLPAKHPWIVKVVKSGKDLKVELYTAMVINADKPEEERFYMVTGEAAKKMVIENIKDGPDLGKLTINKNVIGLNFAFGAPTFTFKIEGPDGLVLYRIITFEDEKPTEKSVTINNLPVGMYTVTELSTLRYRMISPASFETKEVKVKENTTFSFTNELTSNKRYSHTDVLTNGFRMNADGTVEIYQDREVTEEVELITRMMINDKVLPEPVVEDQGTDDQVEE